MKKKIKRLKNNRLFLNRFKLVEIYGLVNQNVIVHEIITTRKIRRKKNTHINIGIQ